jgi:hypothetical protein
MQYYVTFTIFIEDGIERSEQDIKTFVESKLSTKSAIIENATVEKVKHY